MQSTRQSGWSRRIWQSIRMALIAFVVLGTAAVSALSLDDVKSMATAGMDDNTVIQIIQNSGDKFNVDAATEAELKKAGVSDRVIKALKATNPTSGGGPVGGPAPNPGGQGNLGQLVADGAKRAKQSYDISAATAKKLAEQQRDSVAQAKFDEAFQKVDRIVSRFDKQDKWNAVAECHNFIVTFKPAPNTDEYYAATWCKGQAFHDLKLYNTAAPLLREVAMYGSERPYFERAFRSLVRSANAINYYPATLAELDKLYVDDKDQSFRDEYHYFLGKFYMETLNQYDRGMELLAKVSDSSQRKPQALYALGVMQSNPQVKLYKTAVESFQNAIITSERYEDDPKATDVIELSYLALARIAYEAGNYDGALYYYNKIDTSSERYPMALFEQAWTYFLKADHRRALGTFHSLHSPYYEEQYFPDLWVVEATVYLNLCRYDEANIALETFKEIYLSQLPLLTQYLAERRSNPAEYYQTILDLASGEVKAGEGAVTLPPLFLEAVLSNVQFFNLHKVVSQLESEVAKIEAVSGQLGGVGQDLLKKAQKLRDSRLLEAGLKTQNILKEIEKELKYWDITATEVGIEIRVAAKQLKERCLQLASQGKSCEFDTEEETVLFLVADDWQFWPFEGEYWVDEVGNYKSYLGDRCNMVEAAEP